MDLSQSFIYGIITITISSLLTLIGGYLLWQLKECKVNKRLKINALAELKYAKVQINSWINTLDHSEIKMAPDIAISSLHLNSLRLMCEKGLLYSNLSEEQLLKLTNIFGVLSNNMQREINELVLSIITNPARSAPAVQAIGRILGELKNTVKDIDDLISSLNRK